MTMRGWLAGVCALALSVGACLAQTATDQHYSTRADHDPDGTGRFYMGREIAEVMGPGGIEWLDRSERESEERSSAVLRELRLKPGETVADLGAGSGYFTFPMARAVVPGGRVYAVDVQPEMLQTLRKRAEEQHATDVVVVQADEQNPHLPPGSLDLLLMVDVYHELGYPLEVMQHVVQALKPGGEVCFLEYRKEDPHVPIKELHKMTLEQLKREMAAVGLVEKRDWEGLPLQHMVWFGKR
jgi:ubiquinone/menaquinone biosynthesis C-methylase UbiE